MASESLSRSVYRAEEPQQMQQLAHMGSMRGVSAAPSYDERYEQHYGGGGSAYRHASYAGVSAEPVDPYASYSSHGGGGYGGGGGAYPRDDYNDRRSAPAPAPRRHEEYPPRFDEREYRRDPRDVGHGQEVRDLRDPRDPRDYRGSIDRELMNMDVQRVLRLIIFSEEVPALIGKHGAIIKELEASSGARIKIPTILVSSLQPGDKMVIVTGNLQKRETAAKLIVERLAQARERDQGRRGAPPTNRPAGETVVRLLVPSETIPMIIGRSGTTIAEMQKESGAHISVPRRTDRHARQDPDTIISVHGSTIEITLKGLNMIHQKLAEAVDDKRGPPPSNGRK